MQNEVVGGCLKHPGQNFVNCPICAIEEMKKSKPVPADKGDEYENGVKNLEAQLIERAMDERIAELKKNFSGSSDYMSGVNDGLYTMFRDLLPQLKASYPTNGWKQKFITWFYEDRTYFPTPDQCAEWFEKNVPLPNNSAEQDEAKQYLIDRVKKEISLREKELTNLKKQIPRIERMVKKTMISEQNPERIVETTAKSRQEP